MKRLLVTGATGFIGRACLGPALAAGYEVHALTRRRPGDAEPKVNWHEADFFDRAAVDGLLDDIRPSHALHLAWETAHGAYWTAPSNLDWLAASVSFVAKFAALGGRRFVAAGTCAEYAWGDPAPLVEGRSKEAPHTLYGAAKLAQGAALEAARQGGVSTASGRVFFGYGPFEDARRLVPYVCGQVSRGEPAICGSGGPIRDFLHVRDIGAGFLALLESEIEGACNISSGQGISLREIVERLGEASGRRDLLRFDASRDRPDDVAALIGDNSRLRATGWRPQTSLELGLVEVYRWHEGRSPSAGQ
jgi:nucleoside-diphosphate-sugar epimerase